MPAMNGKILDKKMDMESYKLYFLHTLMRDNFNLLELNISCVSNWIS